MRAIDLSIAAKRQARKLPRHSLFSFHALHPLFVATAPTMKAAMRATAVRTAVSVAVVGKTYTAANSPAAYEGCTFASSSGSAEVGTKP